MAKYRVTLADGRNLVIEAANPQAADRAAGEYVRANPLKGRAAADRYARKAVADTPDQLRTFNKGVTFGFNDELAATVGAGAVGAKNLFRRAAGQPTEFGMKDAFDAIMDANSAADVKFAKEHPYQNAGLQIAGGVGAPGVRAATGVIKGARSLTGAVARSAGVGAAGGAVAGVGNSRGVEGRLKGAGVGAVTGAAVGGAVPVAAKGLQIGGRAANAAVGQPFGGAQRGAAARLRQALQQDGLNDAQVAEAVQQWRRSGVTPEFLNVAGENTRALLRAAAGQGSARSAAQGYRDKTVASIPSGAMERANSLTPGEARTPAQFIDETATARDNAASTDFRPAYEARLPVRDEVQSILTDTPGRAALRQARADALERRNFEQVAEIDDLLRADPPLPREPTAVAERARAAGFDPETRYYHGTGYDGPDNLRASATGAGGPGVYVTPSKTEANSHAARANMEGGNPNIRPVLLREGAGEAYRDPNVARVVRDPNDVRSVFDDFAPEGYVAPPNEITGATLHRAEIAMRERAKKLARAGNGARAAGARSREEVLRRTLDNAPGMGPARAHYRDASQAIDAADDGASVMGPRSTFEPEIDALGEQGRLAAQIRERQALHDGFSTRDQVRARLGDIANAPDVRPNLFQLYGEEGERFADAADNLVRKQDDANFIAPNTGSQTHSLGEDAQAFGAVGQMLQLVSGSLRPVVERMARGLTMTEREREILVRIGIGTPEDAARALQVNPLARRADNLFSRVGPAAASTAASERQRPAVEAWLENDPSVRGASYGAAAR